MRASETGVCDMTRAAPGSGEPDMWTRHANCSPKWFVVLLAALSLAVYVLTYATDRFGDPIRADGLGYYAYLPSIFLYHDVTFGPEAAKPFGGEFPAWSGIRPFGTEGYCANRYSMGVSILAAPFFLVAHLLTLIAQSAGCQLEADGYSFFYQHGYGLAGLVYLLLGVVLLWRLLATHFSRSVTLATLVTLLFGTNLFHYGTGESIISHTYSFFLFAGLMLQIPAWYRDPVSIRRSLLLGATLGLVALVRLPNLLVGVLLLLYAQVKWSDVPVRVMLLVRRIPALAWALLAFLLVVLPQLWLWHRTSGQWLMNGYSVQGEGAFHFLNPEVLNVLFSFKKGALFWCPVLMLALVGLPALKRQIPEWFWSVLVFLILNLYVISSWWNWWFGGGFGHRAFIESYPLMALSMAAFFAETRGRGQTVALAVFCFFCIAWTQLLAVLYYLREIDYEGLDAQAVYDILWSIKEVFRGLMPL